MITHQMTTAVQLHDGDVPVNEHTKVEKIVIVAADGTALQAILDDFEARLTVLEP